MSKLSIEEKIKNFPTTIYARVVGWITPLRNWNKGKQAEYKDRVTYNHE